MVLLGKVNAERLDAFDRPERLDGALRRENREELKPESSRELRTEPSEKPP